MKLSHVKTVTQLGLGFGTQIEQGHLPGFVSGCLARYHHIAFNLAGDLVFGHARIGHHVLNGFFTAPAFGVQAGIYHQTHGTKHLGLKASQITEGVIVI